MKKVIILLAVVLCSAVNVFPQAQDGENSGYVNAFEADSAVWSYLFHDYRDPPRIVKLILSGDTVIGDIRWKMIKIMYEDDFTKSLVRTDGKKVIVRSYPGEYNGYLPDEEVIIYDFSLNTGDSVLISYQPYKPGYHYEPSYKEEITGIDSIVLNDGQKHKRIKFGRQHIEDFSIEGIGCVLRYNSHLFFMLQPVPTGDTMIGPTFVCCEVDGELLYLSPLFSDCDIFVGNERIEPEDLKIIADNGVLRVVYYEAGRFDVSLYNMQGMLVKQQNDNSGEVVMQLSNLARGIYIVYITSGNKTYSQKIYTN